MCDNGFANGNVFFFQGVYHAGNVAVCFEAFQMEMRQINSNQPLLCALQVDTGDHQCYLAAQMKVTNKKSLKTNVHLEPEVALNEQNTHPPTPQKLRVVVLETAKSTVIGDMLKG